MIANIILQFGLFSHGFFCEMRVFLRQNVKVFLGMGGGDHLDLMENSGNVGANLVRGSPCRKTGLGPDTATSLAKKLSLGVQHPQIHWKEGENRGEVALPHLTAPFM